MNSEINRLNSFRHWPANTGVDPTELARAGFFYTGQRDLVKCFCCGLTLHKWCEGDDPFHEHHRHSANCPFLTNPFTSGNVPIQYGPEETNSWNNREQRIRQRSQVSHLSESSEIPIRLRSVRMRTHLNPLFNQWQLLNINTNRPKNPYYTLLANRRRSFRNWPIEHKQKAERLAEAGFFYTGMRDYVRCPFCGGGLRNWDRSDDPWVEHAKWFGNCSFIQENNSQKLQETEDEEDVDVQGAEETLDKLEKENQQLKDQRLCKICLDKDCSVVFLPCGHMCACQACAGRLRECPICNGPILGTVKAFLA